MSLAMPDLARLARTTSVVADVATRERNSPTVVAETKNLLERQHKFLGDQIERLSNASTSGSIGAAREAISMLHVARGSLVDAGRAIAAGERTQRPYGSRIPFLSNMGVSMDITRGAAALSAASTRIGNAAEATRAVPGTHVISADASPYLLRGADVDAAIARGHVPSDASHLTDGQRELLDRFSPDYQRKLAKLIGGPLELLFGTRTVDAHKLTQGDIPGLGSIYVGTHQRPVDPPEFVRMLNEAGAPAVRAIAQDSVVRQFPFLGSAGLFGRSNLMHALDATGARERVPAKDIMPIMVDQGQSLLVFPPGTLSPFPGVNMDGLPGAARTATLTGAPIHPTATHGLGTKLDVRQDGPAGLKPLTIVTDPIHVRPAARDASPAQVEEQTFQVTELLNQRAELDQTRVFDAWRNQR